MLFPDDEANAEATPCPPLNVIEASEEPAVNNTSSGPHGLKDFRSLKSLYGIHSSVMRMDETLTSRRSV